MRIVLVVVAEWLLLQLLDPITVASVAMGHDSNAGGECDEIVAAVDCVVVLRHNVDLTPLNQMDCYCSLSWVGVVSPLQHQYNWLLLHWCGSSARYFTPQNTVTNDNIVFNVVAAGIMDLLW
jgi:hypothetical protein